MKPKTKQPSKADTYGDQDMASIIAELNKQYGANTLVIASDVVKLGVDIIHIRTGCVALDLALGGGLPRNRITEIRGPFSSFKSTLSLTAVAAFQQQYPDGWAVYIDLERSFDPRYAQRLGVDLRRLVIVNPETGEQSVDVLNKLMTASLDMFVIIDSIAAMVPSAELEADVDKTQIALHARLVNRAMRIINARLKRALYDNSAPATTVVALNQLRSKAGVVFGNPETTPGGMGKDFFFSNIIRLQSSPSNADKKEQTVNGVKKMVNIRQVVTFNILKNKTGGPQHEQGEFVYNYQASDGCAAGSFSNAESLFQYGVFFNVIKVNAKGCYAYDRLAFKRESDFVNALRKDPGLMEELFDLTLDAIKMSNSPTAKPASKFAAADDDEEGAE